MILALNDIIGLPFATPAIEMALAAECARLTLFDKASVGDPSARRELIELEVAYLNWAYTPKKTPVWPHANASADAA